jgi:hypothetical protein
MRDNQDPSDLQGTLTQPKVDSPTGDDPYIAGADEVSGGVEPDPLSREEQRAVKMQKLDPDGPSYEAHVDPDDHSTGGSVDPNNSHSFSDSGNES